MKSPVVDLDGALGGPVACTHAPVFKISNEDEIIFSEGVQGARLNPLPAPPHRF